MVPHWKRSVVLQETGLTIALSEDAKDRQAKHDSHIVSANYTQQELRDNYINIYPEVFL